MKAVEKIKFLEGIIEQVFENEIRANCKNAKWEAGVGYYKCNRERAVPPISEICRVGNCPILKDEKNDPPGI